MPRQKTYMEQLEDDLKNSREKLNQSIKAGQFKASKEGKVALTIIDDEVSRLVTQAFSKKPLEDRDYLSVHGQVYALQKFRRTLEGKAEENESANEEVKAIDDQIKAIKSDSQ